MPVHQELYPLVNEDAIRVNEDATHVNEDAIP